MSSGIVMVFWLWCLHRTSAHMNCSVTVDDVLGPLQSKLYKRKGFLLDSLVVNYTVSACGESDTQQPGHYVSIGQFLQDGAMTGLRADSYVMIYIRCKTPLKLDSLDKGTVLPIRHIVLSRLVVTNCAVSTRLAEIFQSVFRMYGLILLDSILYFADSITSREETLLLESVGELTLKQVKNNITLDGIPLVGVRYESIVKLGLLGTNLGNLPDKFEEIFPRIQTLALGNNSFTSPPKIVLKNTTSFLPNSVTRTEQGKATEEYVWNIDIPLNSVPQILDISWNNIKAVDNSTFSGFVNLLNLGYNAIEYIGNETFSRVNELQSLYLNSNKISSISQRMFTHITTLITLYLCDNDIKSIDDDAFKDLANLQLLHLGRNKLPAIKAEQFRGLWRLRVLVVSENRISAVDRNFLPSSPFLEIANFSHNPLKVIPPKVFSLFHLTRIDFSYTGVGLESFVKPLSKVPIAELSYRLTNTIFRSIVLKGNNITSVYSILPISKTPAVAPNLGITLASSCFDVTFNNLSCDCDMGYFLSYLNLSKVLSPKGRLSSWETCWKGWICRTPAEFKERDIFSLDTSRLYCPDHESNCPKDCQCYKRYHNSGKVINCHRRKLRQLPYQLPSGLLDVRIEENNLSNIQERDYLGRIERLYLTRNSFTYLSTNVMRKMSNLTHLHIDFNQLVDFPVFLKDAYLMELRLDNNPFKCSCPNRWFKTWLIQNKAVVLDWNNISCYVRDKIMLVLDVTDEDLKCDLVSNIGVAVGFSIFGLAVLVFVVALIQYRQELRVLWFIYNSKNRGTHTKPGDRAFQAYILFAEQDRVWTAQNIQKPLESHFPHIYSRFDEFVPGVSMSDNVTAMLTSTNAVVVVLSKALMNDTWCKFALQSALHIVVTQKLHFVTLVKLENFSPESESQQILKNYLQLKRYISPKEKLFAQKLIYSVLGRCREKTLAPDYTVKERYIVNDDRTRSFSFDVGLLYGDTDRRWVIQDLLPFLEADGETVCLPDRDDIYVPGAPDKDNILRLIDSCKTVILIVSEDFLQTERCLFSFRAAYGRNLDSRNHAFLLIFTEDIRTINLAEINAYRHTHVCLEKNDPFFTQQLLRALQHKKYGPGRTASP